ncbi:MAG: MFS transporter [Ruminiclostridium sp.]
MNTKISIELNQTKKPTLTRGKNAENSNIARFLCSKTISLLGTNLYTFALSLYILKTTGSGTSFAINVLIGMLPRILIGPFAGILADRANKKKLTVTFDLLSGGIMFLLVGLSYFYGLKILFIYAANLLLSIINIFYDTAMNSAIPNLVSSQKLIKINSFTTTASSIAGILSPVIAGIIYGFIPIKLFLIVNGISFLISSVLELKIDFKFNQGESIQSNTRMSFRSVKLDFMEIWNFIKEQKGMLQLLKYLLIINFFFHALISVIYPYLINHVLHLASSQYGAFQAFYFVGMIITSVLIASRKENKNVNIGKGIILTGVIAFLIGLPSLGIHFLANGVIITIYNILLIFTMGAALTSINIPAMVAIQRMTPENIRGRIMGVLGILTAGIAPLGIVLSGLIINKVHPFILLSVIGVCITVTGLALSRNKELSFS